MIALAAVLAAAVAPPGPVDFTAQTMRMEPRERRTLLDGAVRLSRGGMVVTGDRAVVEFAPDEQPPAQPQRKARRRGRDEPALLGQKLERFTVDGNVHVQRGDRTADGAHGVFDSKAQTLVLTGDGKDDPVLRDGSETLRGDRIVMRLDTEDVDVQKPRLVLRRSVPEAEEEPHTERARHLEALRRPFRGSRKRRRRAVRAEDLDATAAWPAWVRFWCLRTHLYLRGGVELRQGDRRAVAENADYDALTREVVLTGEPRLFDRGDVLVGEKIAMTLDSHEVRVERAHGRLRPEAHQDEAGAGVKR